MGFREVPTSSQRLRDRSPARNALRAPVLESSLKIVILGKGKSGTTVLMHMITAAFPECRPVPGGFHAHVRDRRAAGVAADSFVCKFTYNDKKGRSFDAVERHIADEGYQKKIWVTRDPRDNAVSDALFRWRRRHGKSGRQFRACLSLVERKERDPRSVDFSEIYRFTGDRGGPATLEKTIADERTRYRRMTDFVGGLGPDWFIFKYEDLVDGNLAALSEYLGREVLPTSELPREDRVKARTKSYGDWRNWFTEEDVRIFEPLFAPYMELVGYDGGDWELAPEPTLDPATTSLYMRRIAAEGRLDRLRGVKKRMARVRAAAAGFVGRNPT